MCTRRLEYVIQVEINSMKIRGNQYGSHMMNTRKKRRRNINNNLMASTKRNKPNLKKKIADLKLMLIRFMEASEKRHDAKVAVLRDQQVSLRNQQEFIFEHPNTNWSIKNACARTIIGCTYK